MKFRSFKKKISERWKRFARFTTDFSSDIQIIAGVLILAVASLCTFGVGAALYTLGGLSLALGLIGRYLDRY